MLSFFPRFSREWKKSFKFRRIRTAVSVYSFRTFSSLNAYVAFDVDRDARRREGGSGG